MGEYLETWRTPYWRRVLSTVLFVAGFVAWAATYEQARRAAERGERWGALAAAAVPGLAVAAALLAAGAWPLAVNARLEGRSPWRELGGASLSALVLVLYGVAKLAAVRHPSVAPWIPVAACGAIGVAALATARPRRRAWAWAAAWLGLAAWLAVGAWK